MTCTVHNYAVENAVVTFHFVDGGTEHSLQWTELLTTDETPFESYEQLSIGMHVLAPWYSGKDSANIQYAEAEIVEKEDTLSGSVVDETEKIRQQRGNPIVKVHSK